jgi:hypothetical protein
MAIEDGRLDAPSVDSFARHAATCADCARAAEQLSRLREARTFLEPRRLSPFEHRRKRAELLRRANSEALRPPRRSTFIVLLFAAAAVVTVFSVVRVERRALVSAPITTSATASPRPKFELRPIGAAEWRDATAGSLGSVVLAAGTLGVHVEHLANGQRFVVSLPDGELEVRGTRFIVEVRDARTERVLVTEGSVSLRLNGGPPRMLAAGDSYLTTPVATASSSTVVVDHPVVATAPSNAVVVVDHLPSRPVQVRAGSALSAAAPATAQLVGTAMEAAVVSSAAPRASDAEGAGEAFHAAMASFSVGAYAEADERLAEFVARFPNDSRDEDAAFLRTVIALRRGDRAAAAARARAYLRRFPDGLRRQEIERMLDPAKSR